MHVIRLREPWQVTYHAEQALLSYSRKFHRPTGIQDQPVAIVVQLAHSSKAASLTATLNGVVLHNQANEAALQLDFLVADLQAFNLLELRIADQPPPMPAFPKVGQAPIVSVELRIGQPSH